MTDYTQNIQEESAEPSFFAMIPHMAMMDLDPFELTLYCHYKKVVGESADGKCFKSNKALSAETKMSVSQLRRARKGLEDRHYISVIHNPDPNGNINTPPTILIKNIWAINRQVSLVEYGGAVLPEQGGVSQNRGGCLTDTHNKRNLNKKKDSAPKNGAGATEKKKQNPWYDVVLEVWGYAASLNGEMQKMLQGISRRNGFKQGNVEPALTVEQVRRWAAWYRNTELGGNPKLNMLEDRMKIQSSVAKWRSLGCPEQTTPEYEDYVSDDDDNDAESPSDFLARMRRDHGWE